jgi:uncharacterized protein YbcC (UPF0753/DUF2309 family)
LAQTTVYDTDMPKTTISETQKKKMEALAAIMDGYSSTDFTKIFTSHLAVPGWTGYIKSRIYVWSQWQKNILSHLEDYLAVRLCALRKYAEIYPKIMILQPSHHYRSYNTFG